MKTLIALIFGFFFGLYIGASFPDELHELTSPLLSLSPHFAK
ncbi:MAG TPA: hypothetical protein VGG10_16595 [Rhizomicrobium sp.]|jgi:hypothetical protein